MSFFAPAIGGVWRQLESHGIDPGPVFHRAGIDPKSIFDQGARISFDAHDSLISESAKMCNDPFFGLKEAEHFRPAHLGALGFAWLASSSLRTAFQRLSRYSKMINDFLNITLEEDGAYFTVSVVSDIASENEPLKEDGQMAIATKCCRAIFGDRFQPARVHFRHAEPDDTSYFYEYFRCPVDFGSESTKLFIPIELMDKRLTGSNDQLAKLNEHIVVKYLAHREKKDIVNRAKAAIIDGLGSGGVTEQSIADEIHMTARNLHRKLQKEDTSFKNLLNDVRQELAQQYIQDRSITLTEISFMLGFSEVSSFSRAFKNWTGKPPSVIRQEFVEDTA